MRILGIVPLCAALGGCPPDLRADSSALLTRSRSRFNSRNSTMSLDVVSVRAASRCSRVLNWNTN
jgi:hypothetical protein